MWNERQRTQKIGFELERVKRELEEQDRELAELMEACGAEMPDEPHRTASHSELRNDTFVLRG